MILLLDKRTGDVIRCQCGKTAKKMIDSNNYVKWNQPKKIQNKPAKIVCQNHKVVTYEINGKKQHIVELVKRTKNRKLVNSVIQQVGRRWQDVFNAIDNMGINIDSSLDATINNMTYF